MNRAAIPACFALLLGCPTEPSADPEPEVVLLDDDDAPTASPLPTGSPAPAPSFDATCAEVEPNDAPIVVGDTATVPPPWADSTACGVLADGVQGFSGRINHVRPGSWEGDNDAFTFTVPAERAAEAVVQWEPLSGDLDARLWCSTTGNSWSDAADAGLATAELPERAPVTLPAGATCHLFVVAYDSEVVDYVAWIE